MELDDEFEALMKTAAPDVKDAYTAEIAELDGRDAGQETSGESDDHLVVDEYLSDTEDSKSENSDEEDPLEDEHVTKVWTLG